MTLDIQSLQKQLATILGGDSLAFKLIQLAVTGHMTQEQQLSFIADVIKRGMVLPYEEEAAEEEEVASEEKDEIIISEEFDDEGEVIEGAYQVTLKGRPADLYSISTDYFDSEVDAHAFAEEVSNETGVPITWDCLKPGWA